MMTMSWFKKSREDCERQAVAIFEEYLDRVVALAKVVREDLPGTSHRNSLQCAPELDIRELKRLLGMNNDQVMDWANQLPKTYAVLGVHRLKVIHGNTSRRSPEHNELIVVTANSTPNVIYLS
jgi:hypothetical protein